jgi:hypothetical protein
MALGVTTESFEPYKEPQNVLSMDIQLFQLDKIVGVKPTSTPASQLQWFNGLISDLLSEAPVLAPWEAQLARHAGGHGPEHEFVAAECSAPTHLAEDHATAARYAALS